MAVRAVVKYPSPILKTPSRPMEPGKEASALAKDLVETMRASSHSVGIAANQIGVNAQMFCLDVTGHKKAVSENGLIVMMNPTLVESSGSDVAREGCMSVPDFTGDVIRASTITVHGFTPSGLPLTVTADAFEARAIQHEIDHLNGFLFLDRIESPTSLFRRKSYKK